MLAGRASAPLARVDGVAVGAGADRLFLLLDHGGVGLGVLHCYCFLVNELGCLSCVGDSFYGSGAYGESG